MRWLSGEGFIDDQWLSIMPNATHPETDLKDCNFPLLPYSNRIRDGRFTFEGKPYQLNNGPNHAIHGFLRDQAWDIEEASENQLITTFDSDEASSQNWPWPLRARCELSVTGPILRCSLQVENKGGAAMPIGGGWHPYFVRNLKKAEPKLSIPVTGVYHDTGGDCLPIGEPQTIPEHLSFNNRTTLSPTQRIDHCFSGLCGPLEIHWPDVGATLTMHGSDNVTHAILFNPDKPYFALEPVTNANDGVNLNAQGVHSGIALLRPDEILRTTLDMKLN